VSGAELTRGDTQRGFTGVLLLKINLHLQTIFCPKRTNTVVIAFITICSSYVLSISKGKGESKQAQICAEGCEGGHLLYGLVLDCLVLYWLVFYVLDLSWFSGIVLTCLCLSRLDRACWGLLGLGGAC
jgi:hypothetical protein